jgi:hypothetical protein
MNEGVDFDTRQTQVQQVTKICVKRLKKKYVSLTKRHVPHKLIDQRGRL